MPITEISPNLLKAAVGGEDARFYSHDGVDYYGIFRAMVKNYQAGRTKQGASTLTQQLARNTFVDELPSADRSYGRKLLEIAVAWEIEKRLNSKEKILELYLNRVFFGGGFYGADAAARGYFDKHAKDLDLSEAATLIGLLKSPNNLSPWRNRQACIDQRNYVLQRMLELKIIDKDEYTRTYAQDLIVKNRQPMHQGSYAADLVAQQVKKARRRGEHRARRVPHLHDDRLGVAKEGRGRAARTARPYRAPRRFRPPDVRAIRPDSSAPTAAPPRRRATTPGPCRSPNISRAPRSCSTMRPAAFSRSSAGAISAIANSTARSMRDGRRGPRSCRSFTPRRSSTGSFPARRCRTP